MANTRISINEATADRYRPGAEDPIWETIRDEVAEDARHEPMLASFLYAVVLNHKSLEDALSFQLASQARERDHHGGVAARPRGRGFRARPGDRAGLPGGHRRRSRPRPRLQGYSVPLLYFKGFHALQSYRVAHYYWQQGREALAMYLQGRISKIFSVDIHPAARIGKGIHIDHATGVVIGETAVVEDNVSLFHEVTLGGTGKQSGDRHPRCGSTC